MALTSDATRTMDAIAHNILHRICDHTRDVLQASGKKILKSDGMEAGCRLTFSPELFAEIQATAHKAIRTYRVHHAEVCKDETQTNKTKKM